MKIKYFLNNIKKKIVLNRINYFIDKNLFIPAIIELQENNLIDKEIECYEKYYYLNHENYPGAIKRLEDLGALKTAMKLSRIEKEAESLSIKRINHDLSSNESSKISKKALLNFKKKDSLVKEVYYAHENNDFSEIRERLIEYNLIEENSIIPGLDRVYTRN